MPVPAKLPTHQPSPLEVAILCRSVCTLALSGRFTLQDPSKAVLHEACHSGPLAGLAAGRDARGDAVMSAPRMHSQSFEATIQFLYWLLWHPASDHLPRENNVKLTLVLCGAALRGSGSQQRSGRKAITNALRCGQRQRQQRQAQQGQTQHV